jgi:hypothetical protein
MRKALLSSLTLFICSFAASAHARAPDTFEEDFHPPIIIESPQWFAFEFKLGPYRPGKGRPFQQIFRNDRGWMLNVELDITVFHVPYLGQLNVAGGWGWGKYEGRTIVDAPDEELTRGEATELKLYPLTALGVLRIDALARYTVVPLTFAGKLGHEWVRFKAETGGTSRLSGFNRGIRWGAQIALELDFLDMGSARRLDDDYGINHTFLLFEYFESATEGTGDRTYQFGLGLQF